VKWLDLTEWIILVVKFWGCDFSWVMLPLLCNE